MLFRDLLHISRELHLSNAILSFSGNKIAFILEHSEGSTQINWHLSVYLSPGKITLVRKDFSPAIGNSSSTNSCHNWANQVLMGYCIFSTPTFGSTQTRNPVYMFQVCIFVSICLSAYMGTKASINLTT